MPNTETRNAVCVACDRLADALSYPTGAYAATIAACHAAIVLYAPPAAEDVASFEQAAASMTLGGLQELYTCTFDVDPRCTLDVGWHVFGESYDRGSFLATLRADLRAAGVPETAELPDHLTHLLRLIGRSTPARAGEFGALAALALDRVTPLLESDHNPYAFLLHAVRSTIATVPPAGPTAEASATAGPTAEASATAVRSGEPRPSGPATPDDHED